MRAMSIMLMVIWVFSPAAGQIGGPCEICNLMYEGMPEDLSWETTIAGPAEPGTRLIVKGTIFKPDGTSPAGGVILYVYQTDATGKYTPAPGQTHARQHGHLRGWVKTNEKGEYLFKTIVPASYPDSRVESHIHAVLKEPEKNEYYIGDFLFDDDPHLTRDARRRLGKRGGSGILSPRKNENGVLVATRNIVLGLNIPGYPK